MKYILGSIRKIIFESSTSPYKVGLFRVRETNDDELVEYKNKVINFTGNISDVSSEIEYKFYGNLVMHSKYGLQYNVLSYEIVPPSDKDNLVLYLSSGIFRGIGSKTAKKIVEKFGLDTIDVIKNNYEELTLINGVNMQKAKMIHDKLVTNEMDQDLILKLNSYGFTIKEAIDISTIYGLEALNIIEDNIYELKDMVPFSKLDLIFLQTHDELDENRIKALIINTINNMCFESGDTLVKREELFLELKSHFKKDFTSNMFIKNLNELIDTSELVEVKDFIMLYDFYCAENRILSDITRINNIKNDVDIDKINKYILSYEEKNKIKFNSDQKSAISEAIINNFYIITGGPGTGKTTIIKVIVEILLHVMSVDKNDIALLAPTGRSAKRMSESVSLKAYTIHKFLKWNMELKTFQIDEYNKAHEKVVIVDEASMIDIFLFSSLLKGLRVNVKLLLIGDANQLPSINPGDVLNDLLNISTIKSKCLNTIYRVKEGSYITYLANDIKNKKEFESFNEKYSDFKFIESSDEDIRAHLTHICNKIKEKGISTDSFQVLAPMYKGVNGIDNLNIMLSDIFNPGKKYQVGDKFYKINDKVIQLTNDVENNVYNGDIGYIKDIRAVDKKLIIKIDYLGNVVEYKSGEFDRFTLAYAISIHKSQGSEYDNVVIILASSFRRMFYNKLIYTAVTRAKSSLIILGTISSFNKSVQTLYADNRNTYLKNV